MRRPRPPVRSQTPARELLAERNRAAELARLRRRIPPARAAAAPPPRALPPAPSTGETALTKNLPSLIETHVEKQMVKLETKLVEGFREMGERVVKESTELLTTQLEGRITNLEKVSAMQTETINHLRDSSKVAEKQVSGVVENIEKALGSAVPGFKLAPPTHLPPQLEPAAGGTTPASASAALVVAKPSTDLVRAPERRVEAPAAGDVFCPKCTSTNVRRAARSGLWEEFLRLFFVAPFRCRACRHKFYRF